MVKIGIYIFHVIAFLAFVAGVFALFNAAGVPGSYRLYSASAPQITQVYSEGIFEMLKAIAYLLVATFIEIALYVGYPQKKPEMQTVQKDVAATRSMVSKIGVMLQGNRGNR